MQDQPMTPGDSSPYTCSIRGSRPPLDAAASLDACSRLIGGGHLFWHIAHSWGSRLRAASQALSAFTRSFTPPHNRYSLAPRLSPERGSGSKRDALDGIGFLEQGGGAERPRAGRETSSFSPPRCGLRVEKIYAKRIFVAPGLLRLPAGPTVRGSLSGPLCRGLPRNRSLSPQNKG